MSLDRTIKSLGAETKMDVLRKVAAVIGDSDGITVVFRGNQVYTDGKRIVVPSLPEDAPDDLIMAIIGFVDHEVGHIKFTDFCAMRRREAEYKADKRLQTTHNAVEDAYQEAAMAKLYRGAGLNLDFKTEWALDKLRAKLPGIKAFDRLMLLALTTSHAHDDHPGAKKFLADFGGEFATFLEAADPLIRGWSSLANTDAAIDAAKEFLKLLDDAKSPYEDSDGEGDDGEPGEGKGEKPEDCKGKGEGKGSSEEDDGDGDSSADGDSKPDGKGKPKPVDADRSDDGDEAGEEKSGGGDEDGDDGEADDADKGRGGKKPEASDDGPESDDESGAGPESDGDGEGDTDSGDDSSDSSDGGDESGSGKAGASHLFSEMSDEERAALEEAADETDDLKSLHEYTAEEISTDASSGSGYRPFSTEYDVRIPPSGIGTLAEYGRVFDTVRPHVNTIYSVLVKSLLAQARDRTIFGRQTGRVNAAALGTMRAGNVKVFKRKKKGAELNTYVEIIVDQSGSMGGRIGLAQQTTVALAEALDRVGVPYGIVGFTCHFGVAPRGTQDKWEDEAKRKGFTRIEPLVEYVYKEATESLASARPAIAAMTHQTMLNNADGESIMVVAKRVMRRPEMRKILIVLSDGQPEAYRPVGAPMTHPAYMKEVSKVIKNTKGLEVIGIGIQSNAVTSYYDNSVVVSSIDQLPAVAMSKLKEALMPKRGAWLGERS